MAASLFFTCRTAQERKQHSLYALLILPEGEQIKDDYVLTRVWTHAEKPIS